MADQVFALGQSLPATMSFRYRDMGDGTHALVYAIGGTVTATMAVPAADSVANVTTADVVGNKLDTHASNSLYGRVQEVYDYLNNERLVYPTLAAGAAVVSANANWTYGAYATVVPINTITNDFHIVAVSIEACDRDAVFQLELYKGAADDVVQAVRFAINGGFFGNQIYVLGSEEIEANSQVRARLASSNGLAQVATVSISIVYYEHA
jgi:hypothetical protein